MSVGRQPMTIKYRIKLGGTWLINNTLPQYTTIRTSVVLECLWNKKTNSSKHTFGFCKTRRGWRQRNRTFVEIHDIQLVFCTLWLLSIHQRIWHETPAIFFNRVKLYATDDDKRQYHLSHSHQEASPRINPLWLLLANIR